ncbi:MAG TPA: archease [Longimicrobiales bacterium]|nr:archease [Longimicrobiales bacterium]
MSSSRERAGDGDGGRHEIVDHTSEVTFRLEAPGFPSLLQQATRAFGELVPDRIRRDPSEEWRDLSVYGTDPVASLVAWLNEMVYECEVNQWLAEEVEVAGESDDGTLHVRARGRHLSEPFVLVKAATLHGAVVRESEKGLWAEVTLDV